jgi:CheY-like chemotaxis protein
MNADGRQPHILIVNDTQEILALMQELLEEEGYRVTISTALLDLGRIKGLDPDVIILELLFEHSEVRGWEFLTLARLDPELAEVPLVLCTAAISVVRDEEMAAKLRQLNVRVVLKPFNIDELLEVIAQVSSEGHTNRLTRQRSQT